MIDKIVAYVCVAAIVFGLGMLVGEAKNQTVVITPDSHACIQAQTGPALICTRK